MFHKSDETGQMRYREWRSRKQDGPQSAPKPDANPHEPWWMHPENPRPEDPWWLHGADEFRRRCLRRHLHRHTAHPKALVALFLICAGAVLFLNNLGVLPIWDVWSYWPLILVAVGISRAASASRFLARAWGLVLILAGIGFLLQNLGILRIRGDLSWPLMLIFIGIVILLKTVEAHRDHPLPFTGPSANPHLGWQSETASAQDQSLKEWVLFGSLKRRIITNDFRGGMVFCVFGEINIDLRNAQISPASGPVTIEANANFGAINLIVPETWRVHLRGIGIFGGYEDRTIPPRPQPDIPTPLLLVTGFATFGAVVVRN